MRVAHDRRISRTHAFHGRLEVRDLELHDDAVPRRLGAVRERTVVILDVDRVQLQHDLTVADDLLVFAAAVAALRTEQLLAEAAGRRDVPDDEHRL
ncbi:MAG TPA: hypothetical protein VMN35_00135 [Gaiellaceae bacterium]|nr:hypothetical protein [Gaiellaceae bacterium]